MKDIEWRCSIETETITGWSRAEGRYVPLIFGGTAIVNSDLEIGKNGWAVPNEELSKDFPKQFEDAQLRKNHGKTVDDIIGKVIEGRFENGGIKFKAEVGDQNIAEKIARGYIKNVSICANAKEVVCSNCGKSSRPIRACKCKNSHELIRGLKLKELSVVADPAFESAKILPLSFSAAVNDALDHKDQAVEDIQTRVENKMPEEIKEAPKVESAPTPSAQPVISVKAEECKKEEESKKEESSRVQNMGTDAIALLSEVSKKQEELSKKQEEVSEGVKKMQMFWESEFPKKLEQMFWERKKEEAPKKEEEAPKKEESKKEESKPGQAPIANIPTPPALTKAEPDEEDEEEEKKEASEKPILQAKVDISQDSIKATAPITPDQLMAAAFEEIKREAKKFEIC